MGDTVIEARWGLLVFGEEGIPSGKHGRLLPELVEQRSGHIFALYYDAEEVFVKPLVGHDEMALMACGGAPGVLYHPLQRFAALVEIYAHERHRVRRSRSVGLDTLGLGHGEIRLEE